MWHILLAPSEIWLLCFLWSQSLAWKDLIKVCRIVCIPSVFFCDIVGAELENPFLFLALLPRGYAVNVEPSQYLSN